MKKAPIFLTLLILIMISCQNKELVIDSSSREAYDASLQKIYQSLNEEEILDLNFYISVLGQKLVDDYSTTISKGIDNDILGSMMNQLDGMTVNEILTAGKEIEENPKYPHWKKFKKTWYEQAGKNIQSAKEE